MTTKRVPQQVDYLKFYLEKYTLRGLFERLVIGFDPHRGSLSAVEWFAFRKPSFSFEGLAQTS